MIKKVIFHFFISLFLSCTYTLDVPSSSMIKKEAVNSLDCGLIELNNNNLFLNKLDNLELYDFNGNFVKTLQTIPKSEYKAIAVSDSMLVLSGGDFPFFYNMINYDKLVLINKTNNSNTGIITKIKLMDNLLVTVNDGFYIYPPNYDAAKGILFYKYLPNKNLLNDDVSIGGYVTTSCTFFQDSLILFKYFNFSVVNSHDPGLKASDYQPYYTSKNVIDCLEAKGPYFFYSDSKRITLFELINNGLVNRGEIL